MSIIIPEQPLNEIMKSVGFPFVTEADLEVSIDQLKTIAIFPAMKEYFRYFPIKDVDYHQVGGSFEIPFPNHTVYGVTDSRISYSTGSGSINLNNPFRAAQLVRDVSGTNGMGLYGTGFDYGMKSVTPLVRMEQQARLNSWKNFRVRVNYQKKKVSGYTNVTGQLLIEWASYSEDWENIDFIHENDVIQLASANVLDYIGNLRAQEQNNDLPSEFDWQQFLDVATQLKEGVYAKWTATTRPVIIRGANQ